MGSHTTSPFHRALHDGRRLVTSVATLVSVLLSAIVLPLEAQARAQTAATPAAAAAGATGAGAGAGAGAAAAPTTVVRAPRESWTSDRRTFVVGDIITVLIDDYTISTAVKENTATDTRTRDLSLTAQLPTSSKSGGLNTRNNADQQQSGSARRENRFQNEMSARVVAVGPNGLLQIKGSKKIDVDAAAQNLVFSGWVRAQDVSTQNVIESNRVADQTLAYVSPGPLGKPKTSIVSKLLGALWP